jgi:hypothetical protein
MLFQFQLRPIDDVVPWGSEGDYSLSWFGLTDGWYWLKCGEEELFRYSDVLLAKWKHEGLQPTDLPYVDYQIVRLWEDVLEMLPEALAPVPMELLRKMSPSIEALQWREQIAEFVFSDEREVSKPTEVHFDLATGWLQDRKLDVLYLNGGPKIWLWTDGTTMFIHWNNSNLTLAGLNKWASIKGTYSMPLETFIEEVRSFDRRLIEAMEKRVQAIRDLWNRPSIQIDKIALLAEQKERSLALSKVFQRVKNQQPVSWIKITDAITYFEEIGYKLPKQT